MFLGLEHTAIASADPAGLAKWYVDHLEFHINFTYDRFFFIKAPNGGVIEIIPSEGERAKTELLSPGIRHFAILVDDFDGAYKHLKSQGVHFVNEPYELRGNRLVFFTDPEGNLLHLIKREKPLP